MTGVKGALIPLFVNISSEAGGESELMGHKEVITHW